MPSAVKITFEGRIESFFWNSRLNSNSSSFNVNISRNMSDSCPGSDRMRYSFPSIHPMNWPSKN